MMKLKKALTILLSVCFSLVICVTTVNAYGHLINGPRNVLYTVNGGATAYTNNINNAAYNWMYTGYDNPIYMTPVSSTDGSTIDIYSYEGTSGITAYTIFFNQSNQQQSYNSDYWWCKIYLNDYYKYDYSVNHDAVMAHEYGHVWGLPDNNNNQYSIMCQSYVPRLVSVPQYVDNEAVVEIYGRY